MIFGILIVVGLGTSVLENQVTLEGITQGNGKVSVSEIVTISVDLDIGRDWIPKIKQTLSEARTLLSNNDTLLSATHDRVETTKTYPIYLGKVDEYMKSELPRTYFKEPAVKFFLDGGEDPNDRYSYSRRERATYA